MSHPLTGVSETKSDAAAVRKWEVATGLQTAGPLVCVGWLPCVIPAGSRLRCGGDGGEIPPATGGRQPAAAAAKENARAGTRPTGDGRQKPAPAEMGTIVGSRLRSGDGLAAVMAPG